MLKNSCKANDSKDGLTFHDSSNLEEEFIYDNEEDDEDEEEDEEEEEDEANGDLESETLNGSLNNKKRKSSSTNNTLKKKKKKTKGRVKIKMEFIEDKTRRYTTFSKRKTGIMKKAYELSTLTGTQVMLLVASETGHVYTFATDKLQPMITSDAGKSLIQSCLSANVNEEENGTDNNLKLPVSSEDSVSNEEKIL